MAINYEAAEWKDGQQGGTPIDAAALNKMENGISEACAGVDQLNEPGNVTTEDIADKSVTTAKIADGAVGTAQLSDDLRDSVSQIQNTPVENPVQSYVFPDLPIYGTKRGNVAEIFISSNSSVLVETGFHVIGHLKPGCCPSQTTDVLWGVANSGGSTAWLMLRVGTNGEISTYMQYGVTPVTVTTMRISATFVTA